MTASHSLSSISQAGDPPATTPAAQTTASRRLRASVTEATTSAISAPTDTSAKAAAFSSCRHDVEVVRGGHRIGDRRVRRASVDGGDAAVGDEGGDGGRSDPSSGSGDVATG